MFRHERTLQIELGHPFIVFNAFIKHRLEVKA